MHEHRHNIAQTWQIESAAAGDKIINTFTWGGGKGYLSFGSMAESTGTVGAEIAWRYPGLSSSFLNSPSNFGLVLSVDPVSANHLYEFDAPAGEIRVSIAAVSTGDIYVEDINIFW